MKINKINFNVLFLVILVNWFLFDSRLFAQGGTRFQGEIMCEVEGLTGAVDWEVMARCTSRLWWNGNHCLTYDYEYVSVFGMGNRVSYGGFHSLDDSSGQTDLAYGEYEFTFDFPYPYTDVSFTLDLRDAEWSTQYPHPHDIFIKCNANNGILEKKLGQGGTYTRLNESSIWAIYGSSNPFNQAAFQPTKPENFMCYNAGQIGEHPYFVWSQSVGCGSTIIYYKIFRSENNGAYACIEDGITRNSWTDEEVCIGPRKQGSFFRYYAKAYTGQFPESASSDIVSIWANQISKPFGEDPGQLTTDSYYQSDSEVKFLKFALSPNPFNSNTNIHYTIPGDGHVRLVIYNIYGQLVISCVDRSQHAGTYQYHLDGSNLAGGFYLARLQFNNQSLCQKILLLK